MSETRTTQQPRTATPPAAPGRTPHRVPPTPPAAPAAPAWPTRWHQLIPRHLRTLAADLGLWQNPTPLRPSDHLMQVIAVLEKYGWCKSLDFSPTGRMCIRGGQTFCEHTGHVTPAARQRAVAYIQQTLHEMGIHLDFFAWNDLPDTKFPQVKAVLARSAHTARKNGE